MSTEMRLNEIGDQLERAFAVDVAVTAGKRRAGLASRLLAGRSRRLAALAVAVAIVGPGVAYAAGAFTTVQQVEASLPAGAQLFAGDPATCTVVQQNIEYTCTLQTAPTPDTEPTLSQAQQQQLAEGPVKVTPGTPFTSADAEQDEAYEYQTLISFGWSSQDAHDYATGSIPGAGVRPDQFMGVKQITVDDSHHINGGCRSTSSDGSTWECYLGQAAVAQGIVTAPDGPNSGLGSYSAGPAAD
jgi:hypothetical protein